MRTIFDIIARDNASGTLNKVDRSMKNLGNSARTTEKSMARGSGAGAGGTFGAGSGGPFAKMLTGGAMMVAGDKMMDFSINVARSSRTMEGAIGTMKAYGASTEDLARAQDAAFKSGFNMDRQAEALKSFTTEGFNAADSAKMLGPAMQMMKFGQMSATESSGFLADTLDQFSLSAGRGQDVTNKMAKAMQMFGIQGPEMVSMFRGAASGANLAGAGFEDVLLTTGMIKKVLPDAGKAAMAANQAFMQLADENVRKELHGQGVEVLDSNKKFRSLTDILADLITQTDGMTESQRASELASIFSKRSAGGLSVIMKQLTEGVTDAEGKMYKGADAARYLASQMADSGDAAKVMYDAMMNTTTGADEEFANAKTRMNATFGSATQGIYIKAMRALAGGVNATADAMNSLPPIARTIVVGLTGVTGVFIKALGACILLGGAMRMLGITFRGLLLTVGKVLLVGVPLLGLFGALAVGFYGMHRAAEKNIGGTGGFFTGLWSKIKLGFKGTLDLISGGGLSEAVKGELQKTENSGVAKFLVWVTGAIGRAKAFFGGMVAGFDAGLAKLSGPFERFKTTLMGIFGFSNTSDPAKQMDEWRKSGASLGEKFAELSAKVLDFAGGALTSLKGLFNDISLKDVETGLKGILTVFNAMAKVVQWIADAFTTIVDMKNAAFTLGKGAENMSAAEMLGVTRGAGGTQARKNLAGQFENVDRAVQEGKYDKAFGQQVKIGLYKRMAGVATIGNMETIRSIMDTLSAPSRKIASAIGYTHGVEGLGRRGDHGVAQREQNRMTDALNGLAKSIDKGFSISVDSQTFGKAVSNVSSESGDRNYEEDWGATPTDPVSVWR